LKDGEFFNLGDQIENTVKRKGLKVDFSLFKNKFNFIFGPQYLSYVSKYSFHFKKVILILTINWQELGGGRQTLM
jgi:hypothetical protein